MRGCTTAALAAEVAATSRGAGACSHFFHGQDHVNLQSFTRAFRDMGIPLKARDAKLLFDKFDVNRTGTVDCREFLQSVFGRVSLQLAGCVETQTSLTRRE